MQYQVLTVAYENGVPFLHQIDVVAYVEQGRIHMVGDNDALLSFLFLHQLLQARHMQRHDVRKWLVEQNKAAATQQQQDHRDQSIGATGEFADVTILEPGQSVTVKIRVTVRQGAPAGARLTATLKATSTADTTRTDAVRFITSRR